MARCLSIAVSLVLLLSPQASAAPTNPPVAPGLRGMSSAPEPNSTSAFSMSQPNVAHCTLADETFMAKCGSGHKIGTFPQIVAMCGRNSWSFLRGFDVSHYTQCIADEVGIGPACAQCFAASGLYGYEHCKFTCLFGSWCGKRCLECVSGTVPGVRQCAGVAVPTASQC
mmetsp:Transcript_86811/g.202021  ORF Transcript_86811/g.202021 Transcript_86811/m.202021 type:complete len:169 (+) Transcript_86811:78-584(+)